jgi:peptidyl-prolyl cis-trans isomerase SurA
MTRRDTGVRVAILILACALWGAVGGCDRGEKEKIDPAKIPSAPVRAPDRVAASHILIAYAGAYGADSTVTRSREEAAKLANDLCRRARLKGADFAALARQYSDEPTGQNGGYLDVFPRGMMIKPFEDAVFGMEIGQVSDVVETPLGFHVIRRDPIAEVSASHILVQWVGAQGTGRPGSRPVTRTRAEAQERAESLRKLASARGADFAALAREHSDCPTASEGGDLGRFGRGRMLPAIEEAAFKLAVGDVSEVIETAYGFHIVKRTE